MCFKKEYKCYKGKDSEDCCQKRVDEAVARRTNLVILIIGIALMILALTVKTASNSVFVGQVSFASTITSIVLSVIAIWMSITGERSTNEIKEKVSSSIEKLTETTNNSKALSDELKKTLDSQYLKYDEIIEKMENVISNIDGMKDSVGSMNDLLIEIGNLPNKEDECFDEKTLIKMVENTLCAFKGPSKEYSKEKILDCMKYVFEKRKNNCKVPINEMKEYLRKENEEVDSGFIIGIVFVFSKCGLFEKVDKEKFDI